jgi:DNA-binding transcriptional LysR family regulator
LQFSAKRFGLKRLPIELPVPPRLIGIVTVKNRTISPAARVFIDLTREVTKPLAKAKLTQIDALL